MKKCVRLPCAICCHSDKQLKTLANINKNSVLWCYNCTIFFLGALCLNLPLWLLNIWAPLLWGDLMCSKHCSSASVRVPPLNLRQWREAGVSELLEWWELLSVPPGRLNFLPSRFCASEWKLGWIKQIIWEYATDQEGFRCIIQDYYFSRSLSCEQRFSVTECVENK